MNAIENSQSNSSNVFVGFFQSLVSGAVALFQRSPLASVLIHKREKKLRLCETVSLGERRIVAVVQYEDQQFLVGCAGSSIDLLATLKPARHAASRIAQLEFKTH